MANYITEPPSPNSSPTTGVPAPVKTKHIIAIRGPQAQAQFLANAIKGYTEGPSTSLPEFGAAPKKTVDVINEPTVNRIEITQLTADLTLVITKEGADVVGASVVYDIAVPTLT